MTDRDRLIELITQANQVCSNKYCEECEYNEEHTMCDTYNIADHLLANGVIVPPCKVGDKIYFVVEYDEKYFLDEGEVGSVYKDNGGVWVSARYDSGLHYHHKESDFGKTVFLTKEEAEQALKDSGKEDEGK